MDVNGEPESDVEAMDMLAASVEYLVDRVDMPFREKAESIRSYLNRRDEGVAFGEFLSWFEDDL